MKSLSLIFLLLSLAVHSANGSDEELDCSSDSLNREQQTQCGLKCEQLEEGSPKKKSVPTLCHKYQAVPSLGRSGG